MMETSNKKLKWSSASKWMESVLKKADAMNLIPGRLNGKDFTNPVTRAEFAAVAVRFYELLSGQTAQPFNPNPFTDTNDADVLKAYNLSLTSGTGAATFSPDRIFSREEAATMLTRVLKRVYIPGWTLAADGSYMLVFTMPALFPDDDKISDWAKPSVYFMAANGIMKALDDGNFAPRNTTDRETVSGYANITCEQVLDIAVRMLEIFKDKPIKYRKNDTSGWWDKEVDMEMLARMIALFPRSDALDIIWNYLGGYWKRAAGDSFIGFIFQDGLPGIEYGQSESGGRGFGTFTGGKPTGKYSIEMTIHYPARAADELADALPETEVTVKIDLSALKDDKKISAEITGQGKNGWRSYIFSYRGVATLCAYFPDGYETGRLEKRTLHYVSELTVEDLATWLSEWSGLDFVVSAKRTGSAVTVNWAADSDLFAVGGSSAREGFVFREPEMKEWFMLDSLWYTILENFKVDDVYYTMDGGRELSVPAIGYPVLFPRDIPYMGSMFYYAHRDLKEDKDDTRVKWITTDGFINWSGMNLYCQTENIRFPAGGSAKISLYVHAEKGTDGAFEFDDGQDWLLTIETLFGVYQLFPRKYVQIGMVNYTAFSGCSIGYAYDIFHVLVTVNQSAGYEIYDCIFDNDRKAFRIAPVYNATNICPVGDSYAK